jgi:probable phosphoglycerate mutase
MTQLFIIRHGQNDWAYTKLAGRTPGVHLNAAGQAEAQALVERLTPVKFKAIYSSPLERTLETAQPLARAKGLEIIKTDDIIEVDYGDWQGKTYKQLGKKKDWAVVQFAPGLARFPNGESMREAQARVVQAVERIVAAHPKEVIALFTHADLIKMIIAYFIGLPLDMFQRLHVAPASISILSMQRFGARLVRFNDTGPFREERPPRKPKK